MFCLHSLMIHVVLQTFIFLRSWYLWRIRNWMIVFFKDTFEEIVFFHTEREMLTTRTGCCFFFHSNFARKGSFHQTIHIHIFRLIIQRKKSSSIDEEWLIFYIQQQNIFQIHFLFIRSYTNRKNNSRSVVDEISLYHIGRC